jgi:hypothetical protein
MYGDDEKSDLEAQPGHSHTPTQHDSEEYAVSARTKASYLAVYFVCNVSLTIYNKLILGHVSSRWDGDLNFLR